MAKLKTLKDVRSGEKIYPITSFSAVRDADGRDMETRIGMLRSDIGAGIPTRLSQLENDNHTVTDETYVHTDNNLTDTLKARIETAMEKFTPGAYLYMAPASESADGVPVLNISPALFATLQDRFLDAETAVALLANSVVQPALSLRVELHQTTATEATARITGMEALSEGLAWQIALARECRDLGMGVFAALVEIYVDGRSAETRIIPTVLTFSELEEADFLVALPDFEVADKLPDNTGTDLYKVSELKAAATYGNDDGAVLVYASEEGATVCPLSPRLSVSDGLSLEGGVLALTEKAKQMLFDDMWTKAVGAHGCVDHTHVDERGRVTPYKCDIWLTYDEALATMDAGHYLYGAAQQYSYRTDLRVNLPPAFGSNNNSIGSQQFCASKQEVAIVARSANGFLQVTSLAANAFGQCTNLRRIVNMLWLTSPTATSSFPGCAALEDVRIKTVGNVDLSDSPLISLDSLTYLVDNAVNTGVITVTVHPEVYAKLTDETDTSWYAVMSDAVSKNINFATK